MNGWLLWLCICLALFVPFSLLRDATAFYYLSKVLEDSFKTLRILSILANSLGFVMAGFSWYTAYLLGFKRPDAVSTAKLFFVCYAIHSVLRTVAVFAYNAAAMEVDPEATDMLVHPAIYLIGVVASTLWFAYLHTSVRVKATYRVRGSGVVRGTHPA